MAISDYDRQAFAQALREMADGNGEAILDRVIRMCVGELRDYAFFGVGAVLAMDEACLCGDAEDASGYLAALADIVGVEEVSTCCLINDRPYAPFGRCSRCGAFVNKVRAVSDASRYIDTKYCPNCGRRIAND